MEQNCDSSQKSSKDHILYCENDSCSNPRTIYCSDHNQLLCDNCSSDSHKKCKCAQILDKRDINENLDVVKALLDLMKRIQNNSNCVHAAKINNEELERWNKMFFMINKKFANSIRNKKSHEFSSILEGAFQLQKELIESSLFAQLSKSKELKLAFAKGPTKPVGYIKVEVDGELWSVLEIPNFHKFYLKINLKDTNNRALLRSCVTSKLRLPNLKGIWIEGISDTDKDLTSFFRDCTPAHLRLFAINCIVNSSIGIKSKFYIDSFSKIAAKTTKEVYFFCIDFSAEDFQTVIRAAHNVERIIFSFCCIHCSSGLDFGADLYYKTKYLSFQHCGHTGFIERTTDWKADPSCFSHIVDAIGNSKLRVSLKKLNIAWNQTLSQNEVQKELSAKGMWRIFVVQEIPNPLSL